MLGKRVNIMRPFHRNPSITALSFDFSRILKNVETRGMSGEDLCSALIIFRKNSGSSSPKLLSSPVWMFYLFYYIFYVLWFSAKTPAPAAQSCCPCLCAFFFISFFFKKNWWFFAKPPAPAAQSCCPRLCVLLIYLFIDFFCLGFSIKTLALAVQSCCLHLPLSLAMCESLSLSHTHTHTHHTHTSTSLGLDTDDGGCIGFRVQGLILSPAPASGLTQMMVGVSRESEYTHSDCVPSPVRRRCP